MQKRVYQEKLVYRKTSLAKPTPIETLFSPEEADKWQFLECLQKLHIEEYETIGAEITRESLAYFTDKIQSIYQNGQVPTSPPVDTSKEQGKKLQAIRKEVIDFQAVTDEDYMDEAEKWNTLYEYSNRPVDLYHSGRALKDALEKGKRNFKEMFYRAADAINRSEAFLEYEDRNINTPESPILKNAEDVAFSDGKVYCQLVLASKIGGPEERQYTNVLLMLAYGCMVHAKSEMSPDHKDYAIVVYYVGHISEQMLKKIPKEDELYFETGQIAYQHYDEAAALLENGPDYYRQENSMKKNIENGLEALKEFGDGDAGEEG